MRILLIDDDAEEAELFNEAIERISNVAKVKSYNNGREALIALNAFEEKPNIIFLDLNMPMFSGKDVLKELRSNPNTNSIPVIIYSTTISKKDIEDTSAYQVKAYLQKPEDFNVLCKQLSAHLGIK